MTNPVLNMFERIQSKKIPPAEQGVNQISYCLTTGAA
jgi:hypothetical protein